jgi:hypothetical protein
MRSSVDIAWLAGILEGEGSFGLTNNGRSPCIWLGMTDKDTVIKVRDIIDKNLSIGITKDNRKESYKDYWRFTVNGSLAMGWMMTIYSYMSIRRKAKIKEIINIWKEVKLNKSQSRNMRPSDKIIQNLISAGLTKDQAYTKFMEIKKLAEKV